jgi:Putative esterase
VSRTRLGRGDWFYAPSRTGIEISRQSRSARTVTLPPFNCGPISRSSTSNLAWCETGSFTGRRGPNNLLLMGEEDQRVFYPFFVSPDRGRFSRLVEFPSRILGRAHRLRVYLPPGYDENTLASYPVAFMQDGQNLFFPEEAFLGQDWEVNKTSETLRAMSAVEDFVIIGIHSDDRMGDYSEPGYEAYARSLMDETVSVLRGVLW